MRVRHGLIYSVMMESCRRPLANVSGLQTARPETAPFIRSLESRRDHARERNTCDDRSRPRPAKNMKNARNKFPSQESKKITFITVKHVYQRGAGSHR